MKSLFISLYFLAVTAAISCNDTSAAKNDKAAGKDALADSANFTTASFTDSVQDFGKVQLGAQVKTTFHVLNTGTKPLLITDARPSCGCTVADFTKSAIAPGKTGEVVGTFDSNHGAAQGQIRKTITVTTNTSPGHNTLVFTGTVEAKK